MKANNDTDKIPRHLSIIMDGNGRWAKAHFRPRSFGHKAGADKLVEVTRWCSRAGIKHLSVYAFSTENWSRPEDEVSGLMKLFLEYIGKFYNELEREQVRMRYMGDRSRLSKAIQEAMLDSEQKSMHRTGLELVICFNYGGRSEIIAAARALAADAVGGQINPDDIDDAAFSSKLYLPDLPDPDLLIRTSGEFRLSNFLLWQIAYAEIYVTDCLWPDFSQADFDAALQSYAKRSRRFGGVK